MYALALVLWAGILMFMRERRRLFSRRMGLALLALAGFGVWFYLIKLVFKEA